MKIKPRFNSNPKARNRWSDGVVPHAKRIANPLLYWMDKDPVDSRDDKKPPTKKKPKAEKWIQLELFPSEREEDSSS